MAKQKRTAIVAYARPPNRGPGRKKVAARRTAIGRRAAPVVVVAPPARRAQTKSKPSGMTRGKRLAYLAANKFSMDRATFSGRDLVEKVTLSAAGGTAQSGADVAGTVLYSTQIRPSKIIPNARLGRLMSLFQKFRLRRFRFVFKSSVPSATNGGTMLFVHEPSPNEVIPTAYEAPTGGALSNYDSHSVKSLVPMAKVPDDFKGEKNDHLDINTGYAVGPGGGWFVVDPKDAATPIENSAGQFLIMVQDAHNVLGSPGYLPTIDYEIGSLFVEYEIDVEIASDNADLAGGYSVIRALPPPGTTYKVVGGETTSATLSAALAAPILSTQVAPPFPGSQTFWYNNVTDSYGVTMRVISDGVREYFLFPEAGVYLVAQHHAAVSTAADYGTAGSGFGNMTHYGTGKGSVLQFHTTVATAISAALASGSVVISTINVENPDNDFFSPDWLVGTGGSTTLTGTTNEFEVRIVALPPTATSLIRKQLREAKSDAALLARFRHLLAPPSWVCVDQFEPRETKAPRARSLKGG